MILTQRKLQTLPPFRLLCDLEKLPEEKQQECADLIMEMLRLIQNHNFQEANEVAKDLVEILYPQAPQLVRWKLSASERKKAKRWFQELGNRIRQRRREMRITQAQLAKETGISQGALSRIERGLLFPSAETIEAIARALGISPGEIDPGLD